METLSVGQHVTVKDVDVMVDAKIVVPQLVRCLVICVTITTVINVTTMKRELVPDVTATVSTEL